jgi:glycosyltransferase involved in cell wall biosynthesis
MSRPSDEHTAARLGDASGHHAPILIVEAEAHVARGHFTVLFADLARALHDRGREITVLTATGWAGASPTSTPPFDVRRLGRFGRTVHRIAGLYQRVPRRLRATEHGWHDTVMTIAARRLARRLGGADVIVTSYGVDPYVTSVLAGRGRWLLYQYAPPGATGRMASRQPRRRIRPAVPLARWAQHRRRRHGGSLRLAVNSEPFRTSWQERAPWLEPRTARFACCTPRERVADARRQLGIGDGVCALVFGGAHTGKDIDVVWRAFGHLPERQLLIGGTGMTRAHAAWLASHPDAPGRFEVFDGFATDDMRALLYSAADLVVLSFKPGADFDSGTLTDAISWGVPVVASDRCFAGDVVGRLGLGPVFRSGDELALAEAVRAAPLALDADTLRRARDEFSAERTADEHLAALAAATGS